MATFTITETTESRRFEIVTPGQPNKFSRTFAAAMDHEAIESGTPASVANLQELINALWSQHSVAIREELPGFASFRCRRIAFDPVPDSPNFDITAEYEAYPNVCDATTEGFVDRPPFVRRQSQSADRMFDLYREGATIPTDGDVTGTTDIAGTAVDQQGRPIAVPFNSIELQIDLIFDSYECFQDESVYLDYLNKRNSVACFGFAVGQLLFKSFVVSEIGSEMYQLTFRMVGDQYYHLKQIPKLDINGNVQLTGTSGVGNAATVYWFQMYKDKFDFEDLFTAEEWAYLTRSCP